MTPKKRQHITSIIDDIIGFGAIALVILSIAGLCEWVCRMLGCW